MVPVVDNAAMRHLDRHTIDELGLPGLLLMERAAGAVTDTLEKIFDPEDLVVVLCGVGNNGGDGLALARQRHAAGGRVEVVLVGEPTALTRDAAVQWELAEHFGVPKKQVASPGDLVKLEGLLAKAQGVVDALFGTGLSRPLEGLAAATVELVNKSEVLVVAVDIPSGLSGDTGNVKGVVVKADVTVTFGALKWAHLLPPATLLCGDVVLADIGIPHWMLSKAAQGFLVEAADAVRWLPHRTPDAHKGHFGHLLLVAGRQGRAGAAALGAMAAVRAGAGLVTVATAAPAVVPIQSQVPEAMVDPLPAGEDGAVSGSGIEESLEKASAVAVGPGLGLGEGPRSLLFKVLEKWDGPLLLDADALTLLSGQLEMLRQRKGATVLTPHPGELGRLLGTSSRQVQEDRVASAQRAAELSGAVVVLKGYHTLIAEAEAPVWVNPTGTSGLASGGSGDVLTGVVGGLLAQGLPAKEAAALGVYLHGRAGELGKKRFTGAVPASVVAKLIPKAEALLRERE
ncbi:MAG: NAD(P)H-hydrate dehydratase [Thermoanaerobaculaceae bacterium]